MSDNKLMDAVMSGDREAFERDFGDVQVFSLKQMPDGACEAVAGVELKEKKLNEDRSHD